MGQKIAGQARFALDRSKPSNQRGLRLSGNTPLGQVLRQTFLGFEFFRMVSTCRAYNVQDTKANAIEKVPNMNEKELERLLKQNYSEGTEAFRDDLLKRCLSLLGSNNGEIDDDALDSLAAAGDPAHSVQNAHLENLKLP